MERERKIKRAKEREKTRWASSSSPVSPRFFDEDFTDKKKVSHHFLKQYRNETQTNLDLLARVFSRAWRLLHVVLLRVLIGSLGQLRL